MTTTEPVAIAQDIDDEQELDLTAILRRERFLTPVSRALLGLLIAGAGFLAGAVVQDIRQPEAAAAGAIPADIRALFTGGGGGGGGGQIPQLGGGAAGGDSAVTGTVKLVDGANVYVADAQGNITKVLTSADTDITVIRNGSLGDLAPSQSVVVEGTPNEDGTVTASGISQSPAGG